MAPVLGYWNIRGLCQPIRLLLNYVGQEYEEKYYVLGPAPDYNMEEWMGVKFTLGLPFPNVPYWIDGDTKLVQSHAILKYLARKHNLCPTSEQEIIRCDMLEHQLQDLFMDHALVCYSTFIKMGDYETKKVEYLEKLPDKVKQYSEFLADRPWFAGDKITFVDFMAYEYLDIQRMFAPGCLDAFKNLTDYMARFEALPSIQKYMQSDKFLKKPIYNKFADWRGD
ncbi:glutathione S-transferase B isoform X1 [Lingula anatina]|uniref:glutathione transferase n=1 Tax=Lingula anatina TaxID=7574 RepID=A0A1S3JQV6_LINAN|nr:glutathione S-transferase B isoform X1 [Lingula anatina]|eukprot:XP_013412354.1 glutathione S-transferase B isoform X1 [Lingula anatina]